jgi:hypothetical protein
LTPLVILFLLWIPDWKKNCKLTRRLPSEYSYQIWLQRAQWFWRRFKCEKIADDGHKVMTIAHLFSIKLYLLNLVSNRFEHTDISLFFSSKLLKTIFWGNSTSCCLTVRKLGPL